MFSDVHVLLRHCLRSHHIDMDATFNYKYTTLSTRNLKWRQCQRMHTLVTVKGLFKVDSESVLMM